MLRSLLSRASFFVFAVSAIVPGAFAVPVASEFVADGFTSPLFVTSPPGDTTRLFVVEKAGVIKIIKNGTVLGTPFMDISALVRDDGERGLLGLAFHPNYPATPYFYVYYIEDSGNFNSKIARCEVNGGNLDLALTNSTSNLPFTLLTVNQPAGRDNHKAGWIGFGPNDGYLYVACGDGGSSNDPDGNGQNINTLLGKMLRIDVDTAAPYVPATNPFVGVAGSDEIWSYGLRNPWRCSFDRSTGDLWIGDVGQGAREEIDFQDASSTGGENYGWVTAEGFACLGGSGTCGTNPGFTPPIDDYPRTDGHSVTGGYVYRGTAIAGLQGTYFFADYIFGTIWSFDYNGTVNNFTNRSTELDPPGARTINNIASFGEDANGELYIVDYSGGEIFKIISTEPDADGDGLSDSQEMIEGTNPNDPDSDNDGLEDGPEVLTYNTDPLDTDTDNDGLTDGAEVNTHNSDPLDTDSDNDGLTDGAEVNTHGTLPNDSDTDNDGLSDGAEINTHSTDPNDSDSDNDGLSDGAEVNTHATNPNDSDSDNDGLSDGDEVNTYNSDPNDTDSDNDGLTDGDEVNNHGSNPTAVDSDGDTIPDGVEVNVHGTDPTLTDTDGDFIHDNTEIGAGTDPLDPFDFPAVPAAGALAVLTLLVALTVYGAMKVSRRGTIRQ